MRGMDPCAKGIAIGCLDGVSHSGEESAQKNFECGALKSHIPAHSSGALL